MAWQDEYLRAFVAHCLVESASGGFELASPPTVETDLVRSRLGTDGWDEVSGCAVPVLAVFGQHSGRLGGSVDPVAAIQGLFKRSQAFVMPDATHSGPMERPAAFETIVRDFERSLPGRAGG